MPGRTHRSVGGAAHAVVVLLLPLLSLLAAVANQNLTLQECVSAPKEVAWIGLHIALLSESDACGSGSYALGGAGSDALTVSLMIALPVLLSNLGALLCSIGLASVVTRSAALVVRVLRAVLPALPGPVRLVPTATPARIPSADDVPISRQTYLEPQAGRAPPFALAA